MPLEVSFTNGNGSEPTTHEIPTGRVCALPEIYSDGELTKILIDSTTEGLQLARLRLQEPDPVALIRKAERCQVRNGYPEASIRNIGVVTMSGEFRMDLTDENGHPNGQLVVKDVAEIINDRHQPPEEPSWRRVTAVGSAALACVLASNLEQHVIKPEWGRIIDKTAQAISDYARLP